MHGVSVLSQSENQVQQWVLLVHLASLRLRSRPPLQSLVRALLTQAVLMMHSHCPGSCREGLVEPLVNSAKNHTLFHMAQYTLHPVQLTLSPTCRWRLSPRAPCRCQ